MTIVKKAAASAVALAAAAVLAGFASNALAFADDDARKAIVELQDQLKAMRYTQMDFKAQVDSLRAENIELRGQVERLQKLASETDARLIQIEPQRVELDGKTIAVKPAEKRDFERAVALFKDKQYDACIKALDAFDAAWPSSNYAANVQYWKASAYYAKNDYARTVSVAQAVTKKYTRSPKLPDVYLLLANAQLGTGEVQTAKQTLNTLVKRYPKSQQAATAKSRLQAIAKVE